jgi:SPP1 family phage portal protein
MPEQTEATKQPESAEQQLIAGLTLEQIDEIWEGKAAEREAMTKRKQYYDGQHAIVGRGESYADGTEKAERVTNWVEDIVDRHTGSLSEYQVTAIQDPGAEEARDTAAFDAYAALVESEGLVAQDIKNRRNAHIFGSHIEVHSYDPDAKTIRITNYDPREWVIVRDNETDAIRIAVRRVKLPKGAVYQDAYLKEDLEIQTVYTDEWILVYRLGKDKDGKRNWEPDKKSSQDHHYKRPPVVEWKLTEDGKSLITEALMGQNDDYNEIDSANSDSIKRDVDSMLMIKGVDSEWVMNNAEAIRQTRVIPLPKESELGELARTFDTARIEERLKRTRKHIHAMGKVPDLAEIVGTSGATAGIALKLMFTSMEQFAEATIAILKQCLRERLELIGAVTEIKGGAQLEGYELTIQFRMPVNRIEEWKSIGALDGKVSRKTKLRLLTDITDPDAELEALERDEENAADVAGLAEPADPAAAIEANDRAIDAAADATAAALEDPIMRFSEQMTEAVKAALLKAGAAIREEGKEKAK